jgi:hypothetical protein
MVLLMLERAPHRSTYLWKRVAFAAATLALPGATTAPAGLLPPPPDTVRIVYSEKSLDLTWNEVPGVSGYNVYTAPAPDLPLDQRRRINPSLITSGTHYTYIWDIAGDERSRAIKGHRHYLSIVSVALLDSAEECGPPSVEIDNCYFTGYERMTSRAALDSVLQRRQHGPRLPVQKQRNTRDLFVRFMTGPCATLQQLIRDTIDFREVGACAPLSTVLVKLMLEWGLLAWKIEGSFIKEYHSFVVVAVDNVEYVVDVTADQFIPDVGPVVLPRDRCYIDDRGRFATSGTRVYQVGKIYAPEKSELVEGDAGGLYRYLLAAALRKSPPPAPAN